MRFNSPGPPLFVMQGLYVRFNGPDPVVTRPNDDVVLAGMVTLRGFDPENGAVVGCWFHRDDELPEGTMVITPWNKEAPRPWWRRLLRLGGAG